MSNATSHSSVVIIGARPVGMINALGLARAGRGT